MCSSDLQIAQVFAALQDEAEAWFAQERVGADERMVGWQASLRYEHQGFELTVPWPGRTVDAAAVAETAREIERNRDAIKSELGGQYAAIFDAHLAMLHDPKLQAELTAAVRDRNWWPEYAVSRTLRRYAKVFQSLDNHMSQRAHDIYDIEKSLLRNLQIGRAHV